MAYAAGSPAGHQVGGGQRGVDGGPRGRPGARPDQRHRVVAVPGRPGRGSRSAARTGQPVEHRGGREDVRHDPVLARLGSGTRPSTHAACTADRWASSSRRVDGGQHLVVVPRPPARSGAPAARPASRRTVARSGSSVPGERHADPDLAPRLVRAGSRRPTRPGVRHGRQRVRLRRMPRAAESGNQDRHAAQRARPARSSTSPGVGVGHATVWRDEPDPPRGPRRRPHRRDRGRPGRQPASARRCRPAARSSTAPASAPASSTAQEWGLVETPIFLTSTMQLGRVYDAACELLDRGGAGDRRRGRRHPGRGRVRRQLPQRRPAHAGRPATTWPRRWPPPARRPGPAGRRRRARSAAGTGMSCLGFKGGIGTASPGRRGRPHGRRPGDDELRRARPAHGRRRAGRPAAARAAGRRRRCRRRPARASSSSLTDAPVDAAGCHRLARRAGLGLARTGSTAHHGSGEIFFAARHRPAGAARRGADRSRRCAGRDLDPLFAAVVEATEESVLNSLLQARTVAGRAGNTSYGAAGRRRGRDLPRRHGRAAGLSPARVAPAPRRAVRAGRGARRRAGRRPRGRASAGSTGSGSPTQPVGDAGPLGACRRPAPGSAGGTGSRAGCGAGRAARRQDDRRRVRASGSTDSSAAVYGCRGAASTSSVGPLSTIRPRYMTASRSAMFQASPRSWVTTSTERPSVVAQRQQQREDLAADRGVQRATPARRRRSPRAPAPARRR